MKQILVYGDSLSWGIIPNTRERLPFDQRWPGILENLLNAPVRTMRLVEDCLNGRRTVFDDPFKPGRNGLVGLGQRIEVNSPLALVVLMLGTNDFQSVHPLSSWHAAQGVAACVNAIRIAPIEPGMPVPPILIVAPPPIDQPGGTMAAKFAGGDLKCVGLAAALEEVASQLGCTFFDAGKIVNVSRDDGIHLSAEAHRTLAEALVPILTSLL